MERHRRRLQKLRADSFFLPKQAPWLDAYVHELISFPNAKNDDQVDSTVFALAWSTPTGGAEGWIELYRRLGEEEPSGQQGRGEKMIRVWVPPPSTTYHLITGRWINVVPDDRIVEMTEEELVPLINGGARRVD